ncbi:hypothetical protein EIP91_009584 [Steccherinum ochraceum]|uniref:Aminoglycoside phosphotransferase domain-containing protein n=1 Tax=Steccherinum ochraceum TaxID=92696 RepID=A0A4R0RTF5_9APHY|nr:hypothetical protein EIP91_009584 [Steccherinum ochraceum]
MISVFFTANNEMYPEVKALCTCSAAQRRVVETRAYAELIASFAVDICARYTWRQLSTNVLIGRSTDEPVWKAANDRARRQEVERLLAQLNVEALRARASSLRGGMSCTTPHLRYDKATISDIMGGTNYHIPISFADGATWMCRIRRCNVAAPAPDLQNHIIQSEVATLRFLATTRVPVPHVHDFGVHSADNLVGVPYILMDKMKGHPFYFPELRPFQKRKILEQYADIVIELSHHPFPSIGCLRISEHGCSVGPIVFENHASRSRDGSLCLPGPYPSSAQYRRDITLRHLEQIRANETDPKQRLDSYVMHLFLLENVSAIAKLEDASGSAFFLKHMDDKGDHLLVDDDWNLTGIIDWEWAQACPKAEAFSAPLCLVSTVDYHNGDNSLGPDEVDFAEILDSKGAHELAGYVRNGRIEHRITHCIGCDIPDRKMFAQTFTALCGVLPGYKGERDWQTWKRHALHKYHQDAGLQHILHSEAEAEAADAYMPESQHVVPYDFALRWS